MDTQTTQQTPVQTAIEFVKSQKEQRAASSYDQYEEYAKIMGQEPIKKDIYSFIIDLTYSSKRPSIPGQIGKIYMTDKGIVDAIFLKRYPSGQVWQAGDHLVFTCSMNTELISGTYQEIFPSMFKE